MIQLDFFDKDIVSTLLPINTMKPDKVFFLVDKRIITGKEVRQLSEAIENMLPEIDLEFKPVDVDDFEDIYREAVDVIKKNNGEEIYVDLTGGTELMSACGFRAALQYDVIPIHVDVRREKVFNVSTGEIIKPTEHISLEDCLTAVGAKRLKDSHDIPAEEEFDRILAMGEVLFHNVNAWQKLYQHLANSVGGKNQMTARIKLDNFGRDSKGVKRLCEAFAEYGFWKEVEEGQYEFAASKYKRYMTTFGTWLELYIYIKAKEVFGDAELGVVIDWYDADNVDTQDNEIDVLVMKKSVPIFISCKMRKPVSSDLYEVGYLAERLGGGKAKALLATTFPVKELGTSPKRMYQRMKKLKIGLIETDSFKDTSAAEVFNHALQMTE